MNFSFLPTINWVDLIVFVFLTRGGYIGLKEGFSVELFKTLGAIVACVLTLLYFNQLGQWLASNSFLSLQVANAISFLILLLSLLFAIKIVRVLLFRVLHLELFYGLEKWGGLILGLGRSTVFASLFLFFLTLFPGEYLKESIEEKSLSGAYLTQVAPKVMEFITMFEPRPEGE